VIDLPLLLLQLLVVLTASRAVGTLLAAVVPAAAWGASPAGAAPAPASAPR
jgi:hypothetical protein